MSLLELTTSNLQGDEILELSTTKLSLQLGDLVMPIYPTHSIPLKVELKQKHVKKKKKRQNESKSLIIRCDKMVHVGPK